MSSLRNAARLVGAKPYLLAGAFALTMTACMSGQDAASAPAVQAPDAPAFNDKALLAEGLAHAATGQPLPLADREAPALPPLAKAAAGSPVNISFSDPAALALIPSNNSTFIYWPGYIQSFGASTWLYVWMSKGPGTAFIPYNDPGGNHFHIAWDGICLRTDGTMGVTGAGGACNALPANQPRYQGAMFGYDWLAAYAQTSGKGRVPFNLTKIRVKGAYPISLWFKTSAGGWFFWNSLAPGYWSLPGATNITEFHIASTSRKAAEQYSLDDIEVSTF